jgi:dienelactone hydrolase
VSWLRGRGAPAIGVYGVSLGAHTSALLASLEDGLDGVVAGIPAADLLALLRSHFPPVLLRAAARLGLDLEQAAQLLRVVSPLAIQPRVPADRRFLYAGAADRLAPPEHALALWRHWERPRIAWYDGGHVSFLWEPAVERLLLEAFERCGLLAAERRP